MASNAASKPPIFVAAHPRACSTAFLRVFMAKRDELECFHEAFGDAYYFGPESFSGLFTDDHELRLSSGCTELTYKDVMGQVDDAISRGKRPFLKEMAQFLVGNWMDGHRAEGVAPSLGPPEPGNITVMPTDTLGRFRFVFLVRDPRKAIPSLYRCTIPPQSELTRWTDMSALSIGFRSVRVLLDFLVNEGIVKRDEVVLVDADGMLDDPQGTISELCRRLDIEYSPRMLEWTEDDRKYAEELFSKWPGFHDDALQSDGLKPRERRKTPGREEEDEEWRKKYGEEGRRVIRKYVDEFASDYEYLRQFAFNV